MALPNEPITRQEMYLSNIAGQNTALPDAPITREEMYLDYIAKTGGTGEGDMKKSVYDSDNSVASAGGIKMFVNQKIGTIPQRVGSLETTAGVLQGEVVSIENTLGNLGTASTKNSTSVVTDSSDLVESGAVYDALGFGNKNLYPPITPDAYRYNLWTLSNDTLMGQPVYYRQGSWNGLASQFYLPVGSYKFSVYAKCSETALCNLYSTQSPSQAGDAVISPGYVTDIEVGTEWARYEMNVNVSTAGWTALRIEAKTDVTLYVSCWQLEKGSTATSYEPYHASVEESLAEKCDSSVIATTENGSTTSQAYAVGSHAIRNGKFITWKNAKAQGETINDASDYTSGDVASALNGLIKSDTFSGKTDENTGALIISGSIKRKIVFINIIGRLGFPYFRGADVESGVVVVKPNDFTPAKGETVSGTYYYI